MTAESDRPISKHSLFLNALLKCGGRYLSCGGATSRLEGSLTQAGQKEGYKIQAFAAPTGLFISSQFSDEQLPVTMLERIKDQTTNFAELIHYDQVLSRFSNPDEDCFQVARAVSNDEQSFGYKTSTILLCHFVCAGMGSLLAFGIFKAALLSGCVALIVSLLIHWIAKFVPINSIFSVFLGSLLGFSLSVLFAIATELNPSSIAIGTLLILVPGLSLTSAITELAEQNLVSGTVKIGRGTLILMAMGVAFLLVQNIGEYWLLPDAKLSGSFLSAFPAQRALMIDSLIFMATLVPFSLLMHTPLKYVAQATLCGLVSFILLRVFENPETFVLASFLSSFTVGLTSLAMSRFSNVPSQVFSTPGILALVPGMLALSSFYNFAEGSEPSTVVIRAALTACSIVFGLLSARATLHFWTPNA